LKSTSRLRIWIWIVALPLAVAIFLTLALREAARNAEGRPQDSELDRIAAEANAGASERAAEARAAREQQQVDDARHCGRMVRPMLNRAEEGPLLLVLTGHACSERCEQLNYANALMDDYARLGLAGVWITVHAGGDAHTSQDRAPALSAMVVSQCSSLLGGRSEFWALLDSGGEPLAMPPYYNLTDSSLPERLEAMRTAARDAVYAR
jgi:hypothetical protein